MLPKPILRVMCLDGAPFEIAAITRTSDGHYLARELGDIGFNHFLGKPSSNQHGTKFYCRYKPKRRAEIRRMFKQFGFPITEFVNPIIARDLVRSWR